MITPKNMKCTNLKLKISCQPRAVCWLLQIMIIEMNLMNGEICHAHAANDSLFLRCHFSSKLFVDST